MRRSSYVIAISVSRFQDFWTVDGEVAAAVFLCGMERKKRSPQKRRVQVGSVSRSRGQTLRSYSVGALPVLNRIIARARIEEFLGKYLREDERCTIAPSVGVIVLVKNFLTSRQPIYGVADWARQHAPELLGLSRKRVESLNDDRVGRCLDRLFEADRRSLVLATVTHVVKEFRVSLDELHNDSTTITLSGEYEQASERLLPFGKATRIITWGHNKDHRPDLKQLLYTLTVTRDGAVPVNFDVGDGNLTDDQTHRETWDLMCQLAGGPNFLYVADSKLATEKNMAHIHKRHGRFVTVLPGTRAEDKAFRSRLARDEVTWSPLCSRKTSDGQHEDAVSIAAEEVTKDGYRLLWFHSSRKTEIDVATRGKKILRTIQLLEELQKKLRSPRSRYTAEPKVQKALEKSLSEGGAKAWVKVEIELREEQRFKQVRPGRPSKNTDYRREVKTRFDLRFEVDHAAVALSAKEDGVFPLVSNDKALSAEEILAAYKRQPCIEKRFSQLKTDYQLPPVFLKSPHRIEALLSVYFFALLVEALLERELRRGMEKEGTTSLALYPEDRECRRPTARKTIDLFENIQRHELSGAAAAEPARFVTELSAVQKRVLRLLKVPLSDYDR